MTRAASPRRWGCGGDRMTPPLIQTPAGARSSHACSSASALSARSPGLLRVTDTCILSHESVVATNADGVESHVAVNIFERACRNGKRELFKDLCLAIPCEKRALPIPADKTPGST